MPGVALSRSDFHGLPDLRREKVDLPARGGFVFIREMCAAEMLQFGSKVKEDPAGAGLWLMARSIVDESGERLFGDDEVNVIGESISRDEFQAINTAVMRINGMGEDEEKKD